MLSADGLAFKRIILAIGRTDMRRGLDGLAALVRLRYGLNPLDAGTLFLFCGNRKDRVKGIMWTGDRFIMLYIRLAEGKFSWPKDADEAREITGDQFTRLMDGYTIDPSIGKKREPVRKDPRLSRKS